MCYIQEGQQVKLTADFQAAHPHAPWFVGKTATIQSVITRDNSAYIVNVNGYRYQCQPREFAVPVQFRQCSHDLKWEFVTNGRRAAVLYPDVLNMKFALDYGQHDVMQERECPAHLFDAMRKEEAHAEFVQEHAALYGPQHVEKTVNYHF